MSLIKTQGTPNEDTIVIIPQGLDETHPIYISLSTLTTSVWASSYTIEEFIDDDGVSTTQCQRPNSCVISG